MSTQFIYLFILKSVWTLKRINDHIEIARTILEILAKNHSTHTPAYAEFLTALFNMMTKSILVNL